jgi:hypothetical protein
LIKERSGLQEYEVKLAKNWKDKGSGEIKRRKWLEKSGYSKTVMTAKKKNSVRRHDYSYHLLLQTSVVNFYIYHDLLLK